MQQIQNRKQFKGFTLVELIIVITILSILGTIAYISFQGYTKDARDSSRMSDIKQIYNGLSIYKTQTEKTLLPDNHINIQSGTTTISYQGYAGANVLRSLKISGGKDPGTKDYYIYTTDVNTKKAQLMAYMETSDKDIQYLSQLKTLKLIPQTEATNTGYYQDKKIYVYGDKIGILTDSNKVPLQETTTNTGMDITTLTGITTYFGGSVYSGGLSTSTGLTLINEINGVLNNLTSNKYTINGIITNGSGGTINACGTSTNIDSSGNFTLNNVVYGTNCSGINVTRSLYNCSVSIDGPISLINNVNNVSGSCIKTPTYSQCSYWEGSSVPICSSSNIGRVSGDGYLRLLETFTGDFRVDFTWRNDIMSNGASNQAYWGIIPVSDDNTNYNQAAFTFSSNSVFIDQNGNTKKGSTLLQSHAMPTYCNYVDPCIGRKSRFERIGGVYKAYTRASGANINTDTPLATYTWSYTSNAEVRFYITDKFEFDNFYWTKY